MFKKTANFNW